RDGTSCEQGFVAEIRGFLQDLGYHVTINDPFKGVELVERHGDPARGRHSLQIEINRALYMNEETFEKSNNYESLKADIEKLIHFMGGYVKTQLTSKAAD
ncbi:MAG: N-formylglutamate amidohydrolase, partial [Pseudomonadota bacterium]